MSENKEKLFNEFETVSSKEWKQKIQFELKGADYNDTLVWESLEGIKVKPFYHQDELENTINIKTNVSNFKILQDIFVFDVEKSNNKAKEVLKCLDGPANTVRPGVIPPSTDPDSATLIIGTSVGTMSFSLKNLDSDNTSVVLSFEFFFSYST